MSALPIIGTAVSAVSGIASLNSKRKEAKAQKLSLSKQEKETKKQADIQKKQLTKQKEIEVKRITTERDLELTNIENQKNLQLKELIAQQKIQSDAITEGRRQTNQQRTNESLMMDRAKSLGLKQADIAEVVSSIQSTQMLGAATQGEYTADNAALEMNTAAEKQREQLALTLGADSDSFRRALIKQAAADSIRELQTISAGGGRGVSNGYANTFGTAGYQALSNRENEELTTANSELSQRNTRSLDLQQQQSNFIAGTAQNTRDLAGITARDYRTKAAINNTLGAQTRAASIADINTQSALNDSGSLLNALTAHRTYDANSNALNDGTRANYDSLNNTYAASRASLLNSSGANLASINNSTSANLSSIASSSNSSIEALRAQRASIRAPGPLSYLTTLGAAGVGIYQQSTQPTYTPFSPPTAAPAINWAERLRATTPYSGFPNSNGA